MVDLRPDQLATVRAIIEAELPDCEVWAFGSRAKWTAKDSSDLDIAVLAGERLPLARMARLREAFEESYLPIKVDVVDLRRVSPEFREAIEKQRVVLHKANASPSKSSHEQWRTLPLEECMETIIDYRGKTPRKVSSGIPLITAKVVKGGRIEEPDEFIAIDEYDGWMRRGLPRPGDVLLTMEAPLGEVAQLDDRKVALAQRLVALRGKASVIDNTFLRYALQSHTVQDQLRSRATGTTVLGIKQSELRKINLPIPPLEEQRSIAHMLRTLDDKIELNRRMNATLEAMARALFQSWFVDFDPVRAKAEGRPPAGLDEPTAALFPAQFQPSDLGEAPVGWEVLPLGDLLDTLETGRRPKGGVGSYTHGVPSVGAESIHRVGEFDYGKTKFIPDDFFAAMKSGKVQSYDVLLYKDGGKPGVFLPRVSMFGEGFPFDTYAINEHVFRMRSERIGQPLLYLQLGGERLLLDLHNRGGKAAIPGINQTDVRTLQFVMPSAQVAEAFNRTCYPLLKAILYNAKQSRTLAVLRDALLPRLLSGELPLGLDRPRS